MPRAEAGSTKAIANKIKSKGLGRLRWYCQACEKQCRDENGFKCHVQSESHVRQMLLIGEDPRKHIEQFSQEFLSNFINMLKTMHGEKKVHINQFYQQVIADKSHIHMNSTKWKSLTQFAAYLGQEGICRVEQTEKGLFVSWIDNSPETLRKREAVLRKERQDRGDEEREQRLIQEQIERAQRSRDAENKAAIEGAESEAKLLQRKEGEKLKLNLAFGSKTGAGESKIPELQKSASPETKSAETIETTPEISTVQETSALVAPAQPAAQPAVKLSMSLGEKKPRNVFAAAAKKNPLVVKKGTALEQPKKMTEQERIMKAEMEEMERKRMRTESSIPGGKRMKIA